MEGHRSRYTCEPRCEEYPGSTGGTSSPPAPRASPDRTRRPTLPIDPCPERSVAWGPGVRLSYRPVSEKQDEVEVDHHDLP